MQSISRLQENVIVNGVRCQFLPFIISSGIFDVEDYEKYSELVIQSSEDVEAPASEKLSGNLPHSSFSNEQQRSKRKSVLDYSRDDSSSPSTDSRQMSRKNCPLSSETKKKIPEYVFGFHPCEICSIKLNNYEIYKSHMKGKKHLKAVKAREIAGVSLKAICLTEIDTRYPKAPSGVCRKKIKATSFIQETIEKNLITPCPGLEHVTEIRGLKETSYYCYLCDVPCSVNCILSHLKNYKHILQCLRHFKPTKYEKVVDEPKWKVEHEIIDTLKAVQGEKGKGKIVVEKDYVDNESSRHERESRSSRSIDTPSTSYDTNLTFYDFYNLTTIPDTSKSDYYCDICEAHANNIEMWEGHISGKRHLTNIKKNPVWLAKNGKTQKLRLLKKGSYA